jgi:LPXTG-motif cell wall-anchored protein
MRTEEHESSGSVEEWRREVETRVAELKAAIGRETGMAPMAKYTVLALVAGAAGLALAARRRKRRRKRIRS